MPPVAPAPAGRRRKNYSRWRAVTLTSVYLLMGIHIAHWKLAGKTLAPLELNEVMYTLELGIVTAGFLFMALAVLSVLIFGRFFCSWACHILALEDLCAWLLEKVKIKPKPVRSRVLLLVAPGAMFYMFIWPQIQRLMEGRAMPEAKVLTDQQGWASFLTTDFARNLPGPTVAILTFAICGFAIVYILGTRSFCNYACPYGVIFGLADRVAPGKIVETGTCEQCGSCTAVCQSHIRVHEEIKQFGKVVDPACLKDLDCVAVCPKEAISFAFTRPSLWKSVTGVGRRKMPYDFTWAEDLLMVATFLVTLFVFRGLYGAVPFLMTLGLGAIFAYLAVVGLRLFRRPNVRLVPFQLKLKGRMTGRGWGFAAFAALLLGFTVHSGFIRYHEHFGDEAFDEVMARVEATGAPPEAAGFQAAWEHLKFRERYGLLQPPDLDRKLATLLMQTRSRSDAEPYLRRIVQASPDDLEARLLLGQLYAEQGRLDESLRAYEDARGLHPDSAEAQFNLAVILGHLGRGPEAIQACREAARLAPGDPEIHNNLGFLLARAGEHAEAEQQLRNALAIQPDHPLAHFNLGRVLIEAGRLEEGAAELQRATELEPALADAVRKATSGG